jgi:hypothetical protein
METTYLQLEKRSSQVRAGRNGRRNCRVMGSTRPPMSRAAAKVFAKGPGASETDREKMAMMASIRYCPSYIDQGCVRSERSVSAGEKEVSREAMDDVGDWRPRIRERVALHFLRTRCGMKLGRADRPGSFFAPESMSAVELSRKARYVLFVMAGPAVGWRVGTADGSAHATTGFFAEMLSWGKTAGREAGAERGGGGESKKKRMRKRRIIKELVEERGSRWLRPADRPGRTKLLPHGQTSGAWERIR